MEIYNNIKYDFPFFFSPKIYLEPQAHCTLKYVSYKKCKKFNKVCKEINTMVIVAKSAWLSLIQNVAKEILRKGLQFISIEM